MGGFRDWLGDFFRRASDTEKVLLPKNRTPASFSEGERMAHEDALNEAVKGTELERAEFFDRWRVLRYVASSGLDRIIADSPENVDLLSLKGVHKYFTDLKEDSPFHSSEFAFRVNTNYAFVGLTLLLSKTREAYAYFSKSEDADKIGGFDDGYIQLIGTIKAELQTPRFRHLLANPKLADDPYMPLDALPRIQEVIKKEFPVLSQHTSPGFDKEI